MKAFLALCFVAVVGVVNCGLLETIAPNTAITRSERIGDSFSYSTIENRGIAPAVQTVAHASPVVYTSQPIYRYYNPQLISSQFISSLYPGVISQAPIVTQDPIYSPSQIFGGVIGQNPIFGQYPIYEQHPIIGQNPVAGQNPVVGQNPIIGQQPIQQPAQTPTNQGTIVDDDTVSVESA